MQASAQAYEAHPTSQLRRASTAACVRDAQKMHGGLPFLRQTLCLDPVGNKSPRSFRQAFAMIVLMTNEDEKADEQKIEELDAEADREHESARQTLDEGDAFEFVNKELKSIAKERAALDLQKAAVDEHEKHLADHPVSDFPTASDEAEET